jgi:hypothetical protein
MTKQVVSAWFSKLGAVEKTLPLLIYQGNAYTPQVVYDEVMRGSPLGDALQSLIEKGTFGTTATDAQTVAKLRLGIRFANQPDKPLFATLTPVGPQTYTPQQLLQQIQSGTPVGNQWVNNEINHMNAIVRLR